MNVKVIRNFSMMALMLGAMFFLTSSPAQAQSPACAEQCSSQMGRCMSGCDFAYPQSCYDSCNFQLDQCLASCGY